MVTIKDVARLSGVSPATVSRVLNKAHNVSPEIRVRVERTIKDMHYFPNHAARSLVSRQVGAIAVMIRNIHHPFFYNLMRGFEASAAEADRSVIYCNLKDTQEYRDRYFQLLTNGISDGIILYGTLFSDRSIIEHLSSVHFPFLLIENNFEDIGINQLLINNLEGAKNAVEHLIKKGHRRIALFMEDINKKVNTDRYNGYIQTMRAHGLHILQEHIFTNHVQAFEEARRMMQKPVPGRPTAVFAVNDRIATQVILGAQSLGYAVPRDLSVIGFDNQCFFENGYQGPRLSSIRQPLFEIGRDSINILSGILDGKLEAPYSKTYETELVEEETVAEPVS